MNNHVDNPTELDLVYNDLWNAKTRIEALEEALREISDLAYGNGGLLDHAIAVARTALAGWDEKR